MRVVFPVTCSALPIRGRLLHSLCVKATNSPSEGNWVKKKMPFKFQVFLAVEISISPGCKAVEISISPGPKGC